MKWITEIQINNYRAFTNSGIIKIPFNNHLLIYGENGSGKTSIYYALKDFFESSECILQTGFILNEFEKIKGNNIGNILIEISDENSKRPLMYTLQEPISASTNDVVDIQLANKLKGFIDYKVILKTHALDISENKQPNLFNFFINELFSKTKLPNPTGGISTVGLSVEYARIKQILQKKSRRLKKYEITALELERFSNELYNLLKKVFKEANRLLSEYFNNKIDIDFVYIPLTITDKKEIFEEINISVSYAGEKISFYHSFLNEARLSSLSICLYLASIKINPLPPDTLRVLYLDDVFIGLDMSNRIPLLEIIKKEFIDEGYQLFLSTYDRQWFELCKQWLNNKECKVKPIELFVGDDDSSKPDYPVLIQDRGDYFECAKSHFVTKDYPAAANYLRKACEAELKRILPINMRLQSHDSGEVKIIENLDTLITKFNEFIDKNKLDETPFIYFKIYKKILFNPLSHDDLDAPHYKIEIENCIKLVENLKEIQIKATHQLTNHLKLGIRDENSGSMKKYEFKLSENLQILQQGSNQSILSSIECDLINENGNYVFRLKPATHSGKCLPPVPVQSCHLFWLKPATCRILPE